MSESPSNTQVYNDLINELIDKFETNLDLQTEKMTELKPMHLDAVPNYDGDPATLSNFISACDYILTFANRTNASDPINNFLLRTILSKLIGRAAILIGNRDDAVSWPRIKELLIQFFGDQRDENCLVRDLMSLKPEKNETPYQFGIRCQDVRSLILNALKLHENDQVTRRIKTQIYDKHALNVFF